MKRSERTALEKQIVIDEIGTIGRANSGEIPLKWINLIAPWGEVSFHGYNTTRLPATSRYNGDEEDLSGKQFDKLKVIGKARHTHDKWIVQCECGRYEIRKRSSLNRNVRNKKHCNVCAKIESLLWLRENRPCNFHPSASAKN